jgi:outer membrane protein assembly factor BamB
MGDGQMSIEPGDKVHIRAGQDGKYYATKSGAPEVGDKVLLSQMDDGRVVAHKSGAPEVGDKILEVQGTDKRYAIKSGGELHCKGTWWTVGGGSGNQGKIESKPSYYYPNDGRWLGGRFSFPENPRENDMFRYIFPKVQSGQYYYNSSQQWSHIDGDIPDGLTWQGEVSEFPEHPEENDQVFLRNFVPYCHGLFYYTEDYGWLSYTILDPVQLNWRGSVSSLPDTDTNDILYLNTDYSSYTKGVYYYSSFRWYKVPITIESEPNWLGNVYQLPSSGQVNDLVNVNTVTYKIYYYYSRGIGHQSGGSAYSVLLTSSNWLGSVSTLPATANNYDHVHYNNSIYWWYPWGGYWTKASLSKLIETPPIFGGVFGAFPSELQGGYIYFINEPTKSYFIYAYERVYSQNCEIILNALPENVNWLGNLDIFPEERHHGDMFYLTQTKFIYYYSGVDFCWNTVNFPSTQYHTPPNWLGVLDSLPSDPQPGDLMILSTPQIRNTFYIDTFLGGHLGICFRYTDSAWRQVDDIQLIPSAQFEESIDSYRKFSGLSFNNGCVYFGYMGYPDVYALDIETLEIKWKYILEGDLFESDGTNYPIISPNEYVYIGDSTGTLYCLDGLTGEEIWKVSTGHDIVTGLGFDSGIIYSGSSKSLGTYDRAVSIQARNASTGNLIWVREYLTDDNTTYPIPFAFNKKYIFTHFYRSIVCLNKKTGKTRWETINNVYSEDGTSYLSFGGFRTGQSLILVGDTLIVTPSTNNSGYDYVLFINCISGRYTYSITSSLWYKVYASLVAVDNKLIVQYRRFDGTGASSPAYIYDINKRTSVSIEPWFCPHLPVFNGLVYSIDYDGYICKESIYAAISSRFINHTRLPGDYYGWNLYLYSTYIFENVLYLPFIKQISGVNEYTAVILKLK